MNNSNSNINHRKTTKNHINNNNRNNEFINNDINMNGINNNYQKVIITITIVKTVLIFLL